MQVKAKVSVIIAVYNAADYIERCIRSLMEQTLQDMEFIIIDDGSTDCSIAKACSVISKYPHRTSQTKILRHHTNLGLASTRQQGIDNARGEYIIHCDPDDWVDPTYYEDLYNTAISENADIAAGDYIEEHPGLSIAYHLPTPPDWNRFYTYPEWIFMSLCFHMIRRSLLTDNTLNFYPNINYAEDNGLIFRCYYYSRHNSHNSLKSYYHYNKQNPGSQTTNRIQADKLIDKAKCYVNLSHFATSHGKIPGDNVTLHQEKRAIKEGFLMCNPPLYKLWYSYFREVTPTVIKDTNLSWSYRLCWILGQYVHPAFIKAYMELHSKKRKLDKHIYTQ